MPARIGGFGTFFAGCVKLTREIKSCLEFKTVLILMRIASWVLILCRLGYAFQWVCFRVSLVRCIGVSSKWPGLWWQSRHAVRRWAKMSNGSFSRKVESSNSTTTRTLSSSLALPPNGTRSWSSWSLFQVMFSLLYWGLYQMIYMITVFDIVWCPLLSWWLVCYSLQSNSTISVVMEVVLCYVIIFVRVTPVLHHCCCCQGDCAVFHHYCCHRDCYLLIVITVFSCVLYGNIATVMEILTFKITWYASAQVVIETLLGNSGIVLGCCNDGS